MARPSASRGADAAFSLVELLVALVIAGGVIAVAVVAFGSLGNNPRFGRSEVNLSLGDSTLQGLFGLAGGTLTAPVAPDYGSRIYADEMRDLFWSDVRHSNAVFCLGRNGRNTLHPLTIPMSGDGRSVGTPGAFLEVLALAYPSASSTFVNYRNVSSATNGTIFVLQPSDSDPDSPQTVSNLTVRAIYEIDLIRTSSPEGTYAAVQRIARGDEESPTMERVQFYDAFYEGDGTPSFSPLFVFFERKARLSMNGDSDADPFKVAEAMPFYMIWWPDPAMPSLDAVLSAPAAAPQSQYGAMGGRTSYFFVVPLMPPL